LPIRSMTDVVTDTMRLSGENEDRADQAAA